MAKNLEPSIPTRRSLLTRLKNWDDQQGWQEFFDTYWKLIYGVAVKAGLSESEAQEVVQETIISVAKKMKGFKYNPAIGSFKGWLMHTTRWRITDQFRKRQPMAEHSPRDQTGPRTATVERFPDPAGLDLEAIWDKEWETNILEAALQRVKRLVSPKQYQMFQFYVLKQWEPKKVAEKFATTPGNVFIAKHRVARLIKKEVQRLEDKML